jgi:hypothetical protein
VSLAGPMRTAVWLTASKSCIFQPLKHIVTYTVRPRDGIKILMCTELSPPTHHLLVLRRTRRPEADARSCSDHSHDGVSFKCRKSSTDRYCIHVRPVTKIVLKRLTSDSNPRTSIDSTRRRWQGVRSIHGLPLSSPGRHD